MVGAYPRLRMPPRLFRGPSHLFIRVWLRCFFQLPGACVDNLFISIKNLNGTESQRTPFRKLRSSLDSQVFSGSVQCVLLEISWIIDVHGISVKTIPGRDPWDERNLPSFTTTNGLLHVFHWGYFNLLFGVIPSRKLTAKAPENWPKPKMKIVSQPSTLRCYVSFREGIVSIY